jgi:hypothetical protein
MSFIRRVTPLGVSALWKIRRRDSFEAERALRRGGIRGRRGDPIAGGRENRCVRVHAGAAGTEAARLSHSARRDPSRHPRPGQGLRLRPCAYEDWGRDQRTHGGDPSSRCMSSGMSARSTPTGNWRALRASAALSLGQDMSNWAIAAAALEPFIERIRSSVPAGPIDHMDLVRQTMLMVDGAGEISSPRPRSRVSTNALIEHRTREAATFAPSSNDPVALDWSTGVGLRWLPAMLASAISGLAQGTNAILLFAAIARAIAFDTRRVHEHLGGQGVTIEIIRTVGGIPKKPFVVHTLSELLEAPVKVVEGSHASVRGAAILGGAVIHPGEDRENLVARLAGVTERSYTPDLLRKSVYETQSERHPSLSDRSNSRSTNGGNTT